MCYVMVCVTNTKFVPQNYFRNKIVISLAGLTVLRTSAMILAFYIIYTIGVRIIGAHYLRQVIGVSSSIVT